MKTLLNELINIIILTAWKVSKHVVFSGPYFPVFTPNTEKYGAEKNSVFGQFSRSVSFTGILKEALTWNYICSTVMLSRIKKELKTILCRWKPKRLFIKGCSFIRFNMSLKIWSAKEIVLAIYLENLAATVGKKGWNCCCNRETVIRKCSWK